jgi:hypothetical protein
MALGLDLDLHLEYKAAVLPSILFLFRGLARSLLLLIL